MTDTRPLDPATLAAIYEAADRDYDARPGKPLDHAAAEQIRRLFPPVAEQEAA